jgi:hypothetical protein
MKSQNLMIENSLKEFSERIKKKSGIKVESKILNCHKLEIVESPVRVKSIFIYEVHDREYVKYYKSVYSRSIK